MLYSETTPGNNTKLSFTEEDFTIKQVTHHK